MVPAVDVIEDATGITLYADLPGVAKEALELNVERDTLTI
ncbi:MAG: Hsp20/alpha crystallin family protein, partial [Aquincola sp.]|nr:Hsp20/alpha crystallin family protein [Aquincola sp.]